ncbi:dihydrofolate reductase [Nocardioides daejeonensis]|uniref:dihydrofolate reductase n=1 Tax=Nocardioides daejeonensis TaxID=1046556 RepID=UPI000D74A232|nr:dihydrofolate reductase [Nocardioides daejeonensis]
MSEQLPPDPHHVELVAAYARNRVIGDHGRIPWHVPEDFAHFKAATLGHTLVMGRATFDSIGRPLPGRTTVVLTSDRAWRADGVYVAHGLPAALRLAGTLPGHTVIAGGGVVYEQALPFATHQVLTEIDLEPEGDARYPEFDRRRWQETRRMPGPGLTWVWWQRVPQHVG